MSYGREEDTGPALVTANTMSGWADLRFATAPARDFKRSAADDRGASLRAPGCAVAVFGKLTSIRRDDLLVCTATGRPRFDVQAAADAAAAQGAAAGWLELYRQFGAEMFGNVHGAWSVVIVDLANRMVVAGVDRFAIHPLCYSRNSGRFGFASRADEVPGRSDAIDSQAIFNYVYHHFIPAPRTIYEGVARVDAAHRLVASGDELKIDRYWQPRFAPVRASFPSRKQAFWKALTDAVFDQLPGERAGFYLSGGTDSSTVAGVASRVSGGPVKTFSIGFDEAGYDEMHFARIAAKHFGADHHEHYITPADLVEHIPRVAGFYDQPFGNSSALPAFLCAKLAHDAGVTRMLAGDGGDELFGGNTRYALEQLFAFYEHVPRFLKQRIVEPSVLREPVRSWRLFRKAARYVEIARMPVPVRLQLHNLLVRMGTVRVFAADFLASVDPGEPQRHESSVFAATPDAATLDRTLAYEWKYVLADNDLPKVTGTATLGGVEVGFPLLDDRLVDFSLTLPPSFKVRGHRLRYFFKEATRGFLPNEIIRKKKHGFGLPFGAWLTKDPALRGVAFDAVDSLRKRGLIRAELVPDLFGRHLEEHAGYYGEMIWILMMLELWLSRPSNPPALAPTAATATARPENDRRGA